MPFQILGFLCNKVTFVAVVSAEKYEQRGQEGSLLNTQLRVGCIDAECCSQLPNQGQYL